MTRLVIKSIARKYDNVRNGVDNIMGGKILDHAAKDIYRKGIDEGIREGIREGEIRGETSRTRKFVLRLYNKGYTADDIADLADTSVSTVNQWISEATAAAT